MERMEWNRLLSEERERGNAGGRRSADLRSEFEKDYHRIIGAPRSGVCRIRHSVPS